MGVLLLVLLLVLILGGVGLASAAVHWLLWIALILLVVWVVGFFMRSAGSGARWYRW
jgi:hypothetical protein